MICDSISCLGTLPSKIFVEVSFQWRWSWIKQHAISFLDIWVTDATNSFHQSSFGWHSNIVTRRTHLTLQVYLSNHSILNPDNNALLTYNLTEVLRAGLAAEIIWDWNEAVSFQSNWKLSETLSPRNHSSEIGWLPSATHRPSFASYTRKCTRDTEIFEIHTSR